MGGHLSFQRAAPLHNWTSALRGALVISHGVTDGSELLNQAWTAPRNHPVFVCLRGRPGVGRRESSRTISNPSQTIETASLKAGSRIASPRTTPVPTKLKQPATGRQRLSWRSRRLFRSAQSLDRRALRTSSGGIIARDAGLTAE